MEKLSNIENIEQINESLAATQLAGGIISGKFKNDDFDRAFNYILEKGEIEAINVLASGMGYSHNDERFFSVKKDDSRKILNLIISKGNTLTAIKLTCVIGYGNIQNEDLDHAWEFIYKHLENDEVAAALSYTIVYPNFKGQNLKNTWDIINNSKEKGNEISHNLLKAIGDGNLIENDDCRKALTFAFKKGKIKDIEQLIYHCDERCKEHPLHKKIASFVKEIQKDKINTL